MDVTVDHSSGEVYIGIRDLEPGQAGGVTHYLEKHGLLLHWNGRGVLTGVEIRSNAEEDINVRQVLS